MVASKHGSVAGTILLLIRKTISTITRSMKIEVQTSTFLDKQFL